MNLRQFWYVALASGELPRDRAVARVVLDEPLVLFRDARGQAVALEDRCLHRCAPLSAGRVCEGQIRCGYHGWTYDGEGRVVEIPSNPEPPPAGSLKARTVETLEHQGYVYVRLEEPSGRATDPFALPKAGEKGYGHVRLVHTFANTVTNCVENFVDVPHTAYVHPVTFRAPRKSRIEARISRERGTVTVGYEQEVHAGAFGWFLNPGGNRTEHVDRFVMPNVTSVEYRFGPKRHLFITSQSVPVRTAVSNPETVVYTDVSFDYGIWTAIAGPFVRGRARRIIAEDIEILAAQARVIARGGVRFTNSPIDLVHVFIESILGELEAGRNPLELPDETRTITFVL